jgi:hypothetical protein
MPPWAAALVTAMAACVVREASASAAMDTMRDAGESSASHSEHGWLADAVAHHDQPSQSHPLPRRMVMPHAPGASGASPRTRPTHNHHDLARLGFGSVGCRVGLGVRSRSAAGK